MRVPILTLILSAAAIAQSFEAASIKVSPPPGGRMRRVGSFGGPGTKDPTLFTCENCSLFNLILQAYEVRPYQLSGPVDMGGAQFMITARIPEGATKDQFKIMLQNLLAERFKLAVHRDQKEMATYDLVIAKNGPKLTESVPVGEPPPGGMGGKPEVDKDGFPILNNGSGMAIMNNRASSRSINQGMERLAQQISYQVNKPVQDATGLTGKYDISLHWVPNGITANADDDSLPDIFRALQEQLGLKLEPKKSVVEMLVIDRVDKMPSEN